MSEPHIADAEAEFCVLSVTPDFCEVDDTVVPFDIAQVLEPEKMDYARTVFARDEQVLLVKSVINGVMGNAGAGVDSEVALMTGHTRVRPNNSTVFVEDQQVARHGDLCEMNIQLL